MCRYGDTATATTELEMQRQLHVAEWKATHPERPEEFTDSNSHPFAQVGPFIKVALYNQWMEGHSWASARVGTIYGLRFSTHGLGLTFTKGHRFPTGLVRFGRVSRAARDDGRTV